MSLRLPFALLAIMIGLVGLALDFYVIAGVMGPPQNRSLLSFLVYYWSFLTNLSNTVLLLVYIADLSGARWLGWFRDPVTKAGMAGIMMLVMFFYHFMLAPYLPELPQAIEISNILLHYVTPVLFVVWWAVWSSHGTLRYRDVPLMLVPGLAYVAYVELRGPLAGEYPYTILDPGYAPPGGTAAGPLTVAISVGVLVVLVAIFDLLLVFIDGLIAPRQRRAA
ncbi:Pr6Pr family membrane protein [Devosia sp. 66-22]|uniref:Pr6Pr family membrane protein n=1 Tax=Devosia sp. 66-22 TaxID=1895753 RepID=UPI000B04334E|nr:Pr6Pr family membrane protein [Devosia sp. 66-22]